jgi:hypothetical protein
MCGYGFLSRRPRANAQYVYAAQCDAHRSSTYITMNLLADGEAPRRLPEHAHVTREASILRTQSQAIIQVSKRVVASHARLLRFPSLSSPTKMEKDDRSQQFYGTTAMSLEARLTMQPSRQVNDCAAMASRTCNLALMTQRPEKVDTLNHTLLVCAWLPLLAHGCSRSDPRPKECTGLLQYCAVAE